jgi:hypothetical protein
MFQYNQDMMEGIVSVIRKENNEISSIKHLAIRMELHPKITTSLIQLVSNKNSEGQIYNS